MKDAYKQTTINLLLGKPVGDELTSLRSDDTRKEEEGEESAEEGDSVEKEQNLRVGRS